MLCAMMAITALGCGDKKNNAAEGTEVAESVDSTETSKGAAVEYESPAYDLNPSDYVTLCDYSKIPVTITGDYDVNRCLLITDRSMLQMTPKRPLEMVIL